ncbi:uncharacterized protein [Prorops nasuta]|uniref:uncharacterized protein n=1 Tax=Prorops nasuta TaxID=863751 RepID=UPI0034CDFF8C
MDMKCFICDKEYGVDKISILKEKGMRTLYLYAVKRGDVEHARMLENLDSVTIHTSCWKSYVNEKMAAAALRRRNSAPSISASTTSEVTPSSSSQSPNYPPQIDFSGRCLFCDGIIDEVFFQNQQKLSLEKRRVVRKVRSNSIRELNYLRYQHFIKSSKKTKFNLLSLPPTAAAAQQHTFRTYYQMQTWLGLYLDPLKWGWQRTPNGLEPIMTTQDPAPPSIMQTISCKCKKKCGAACGCYKAGLHCSDICEYCCGKTCKNILPLNNLLEDEDECDDFELQTLEFTGNNENDPEIDHVVFDTQETITEVPTSSPLAKRPKLN